MASRKSPKERATGCGEVSVRRELRKYGRTLSEASGREPITLEPIEGPVAEATGSIALTEPQEEDYEVLRVSAGGTLPCTVADFTSGRAHKALFDQLRDEVRYQLKRGTEGLR